MSGIDLVQVGFAFIVIVSVLYALYKWGIMAGVIVAVPMIGAFVALTRIASGG